AMARSCCWSCSRSSAGTSRSVRDHPASRGRDRTRSPSFAEQGTKLVLRSRFHIHAALGGEDDEPFVPPGEAGDRAAKRGLGIDAEPPPHGDGRAQDVAHLAFPAVGRRRVLELVQLLTERADRAREAPPLEPPPRGP